MARPVMLALFVAVVGACLVAHRLAGQVSVQLLSSSKMAGGAELTLLENDAENETSWESSGLKGWKGPDCAGPSKRLCELGVNVGDSALNQGDIAIPAQGLEQSYTAMPSPNRETTFNTVGGDWFGHLGHPAVTREEVQAGKAVKPSSLRQARLQSLDQVGFFHSVMAPLTQEPSYEDLPRCPCAGVGGMCLTLLMDDRTSLTPCFCDCQNDLQN